MPEREILSFMCDWRIIIPNGTSSVYVAVLRSRNVPNSMGISRAIIDDDEIVQETLEI